MSGESHYDVLGVPPDASLEEITRAYRFLARLHHPDRNPGQDTTRIMQRINRAYHVLGDPGRRAAYDRERHRPGVAHALLRIYRTGAPVAVSRDLQVILNGHLLGELGWNGAEKFVVEPGDHELYIRLDGGTSPTLSFACRPGQVLNFECGAGSILGSVFAALSSAHAYYLRQL